ncbi:unnamed protein product, partial [Sphacelaria rigidula]
MPFMDADSLRVVDEQVRFCVEVQATVVVSRETKRKLAQGQAVSPKFAAGDFVLYARVRTQGATPKLMFTWTGPWRVVGADDAHLYSLQKIVSGAVRVIHAARLRSYADSQLHITAKLK